MISPPFEDRLWAGRYLATELARFGVPQNAMVTALTHGGVPVGYEVADRLHLCLDIESARRIAVPWQPEITIGAVVGSEIVWDQTMAKTLDFSDSELAELAEDELAAMALENDQFHRRIPKLNLEGHAVILVDDGLDTGDTMMAAIRDIRRFGPRCVIVAVPVAPQRALDRLRNEVARLICLKTPERFLTIGEHFQQFDDVADSEVEQLLLSNRRQYQRTQAISGREGLTSEARCSAATEPIYSRS